MKPIEHELGIGPEVAGDRRRSVWKDGPDPEVLGGGRGVNRPQLALCAVFDEANGGVEFGGKG